MSGAVFQPFPQRPVAAAKERHHADRCPTAARRRLESYAHYVTVQRGRLAQPYSARIGRAAAPRPPSTDPREAEAGRALAALAAGDYDVLRSPRPLVLRHTTAQSLVTGGDARELAPTPRSERHAVLSRRAAATAGNPLMRAAQPLRLPHAAAAGALPTTERPRQPSAPAHHPARMRPLRDITLCHPDPDVAPEAHAVLPRRPATSPAGASRRDVLLPPTPRERPRTQRSARCP